MYRALPEERFPIPRWTLRLDPAFVRAVVDYPTQEVPGTVIVDTPNRYSATSIMTIRHATGRIGGAGFGGLDDISHTDAVARGHRPPI